MSLYILRYFPPSEWCFISSLVINGLRGTQKGKWIYVRSTTDFFTVLLTGFLHPPSNRPKSVLFFTPVWYVPLLLVAEKTPTTYFCYVFHAQNLKMIKRDFLKNLNVLYIHNMPFVIASGINLNYICPKLCYSKQK